MNTVDKRHLAKTISWRLIGTLDTILLSWFISGDPWVGLQIGSVEVISKLILYYLHEKFWFNIKIKESQKRHIFKTITWRFVGTADTVLLAWLISGEITIGFGIGVAELFTKMLLYYLHERGWYQLNYGLEKRRRLKRWKKT